MDHKTSRSRYICSNSQQYMGQAYLFSFQIMYESQLQKTGYDITAAVLYKLRLISGAFFFLSYLRKVTIIKFSIIHCEV